MKPSFALLFKRGKYQTFVPGSDEEQNKLSEKERDEKRREIERYVTAAIGFCATYDAKFRVHLLKSICDLPDRLACATVDVLIEPHRWGDLVITSARDEFVCVIECK